MQSFTDELAAAAKRDRVEYLLDLIGAAARDRSRQRRRATAGRGNPRHSRSTRRRLRHVIELVAERSGWAKKKPGNGRALGIAAHRSFLSYVAAVVEVEVDANGAVRIPRVDFAVDAGTIINPDRVRAQFEGAAVFGTSIALMGEITAAAGRIQQSNFHDYPVARMTEAPHETHVHLVHERRAACGRGRTRRAADRARDVQRDLRRHRQAHARPADSEEPGGCDERLMRAVDNTG